MSGSSRITPGDAPDLTAPTTAAFLRELGLVYDTIGGDAVDGHIDAGPDHHTPWGMVHGCVYATAIESAASVGASAHVLEQGMFAVGVSNQTDFLRPHREARLDVRARPIQQGRTLQLWLVEISREDGKLVARGQVRLQNVPLG
jgi:1,4-dihydroxy-2-naphthoyl-CoA hydrolase